MGVLLLIAATFLLAAPPTTAAPPDRSGNATAIRDSVRALTVRRDFAAAESLAASVLDAASRADAADSILASVAEWRVQALLQGGGAGRPGTGEAADLAIRLKERSFGPRHPEVGRSLALASTIQLLAGNSARAESLARRSVTIYQDAAATDSLPLARSLQILANAVGDRAGYAEARSLYERSIAIRERVHGPDHPDVAHGLNSLGSLLRRMGELDAARRTQERAIRIRERVLPPDDPDLAWSLNNYANVLFDLGEAAATKAIHERVLAMRLRSLGPRHPDVANTYNNLANTLHALGDFVGARRMLEASLAIREAAMGANHVDVAQSLNNLAYLLQDAGDYQEARLLYERSLAIRERVRGPRHPDVTTTLDRLSNVLFDLGDLDGAKRGFERSLAINRAAFGDDHLETAETMSALAGVEAALGDSSRAEALYERALSIRRREQGEQQQEALYTARRLAELMSARGRPQPACSLLSRVLSHVEAAGFGATPEAAASLAAFAVALARSGRAGEALETALRAERVGLAHLRLTARSVEERLALRYAATRPGGRDLAITLLHAKDDVPERRARVFDAVIKGRAAIEDELAGRHRSIAASEDSSTGALAESLARSRERLARLVLAGPRGAPPDRHAARVRAAERGMERAERALAERSVPFRAEEATRVAGVEEVLQAMPSGAALVSYVRYHRTALASDEEEGVHWYGAFFVRAGEDRVTFVPLAPADAVESACEAWRKEVGRRPSPARRAADERRCRLRGTALRALVWDPLRPALTGASLLLLVPDGALHRVSFAALPAETEGYLLQAEPPIHVLPAERDLLRAGEEAPKGRGLLALGGPNFDAAPSVGRVGPASRTGDRSRGPASAGAEDCVESVLALRFAPLPGAREEARDIAREWVALHGDPPGGRAASRAGAGTATLLVDGDATEDAVKRMAPGRRIVHIATHGFFLRPGCRPRPAPGAHEPPRASSPLLRVGLALAGSNGRPRPHAAPEDGLLTAEEIAGVDLTGVEWVVLSACDTGAGEEHVSEGLLGLRRAIQSAGASTVILSLWRVDDNSTRSWMRALYRARFARGWNTAHAARQAALEVLEAQRARQGSTHPHAWGAFVAAGDWR